MCFVHIERHQQRFDARKSDSWCVTLYAYEIRNRTVCFTYDIHRIRLIFAANLSLFAWVCHLVYVSYVSTDTVDTICTQTVSINQFRLWFHRTWISNLLLVFRRLCTISVVISCKNFYVPLFRWQREEGKNSIRFEKIYIIIDAL